MSKDLEAQLEELGADYRTMVGRMKRAYEPVSLPRPQGHFRAYLVAASLTLVLGLGVLVNPEGNPGKPVVSAGAVERNEFMLAYAKGEEAVKEIIRTQNPDGSWKTDFLTRQNAAALSLCDSADARLAYRKAMRNLRTRGIL